MPLTIYKPKDVDNVRIVEPVPVPVEIDSPLPLPVEQTNTALGGSVPTQEFCTLDNDGVTFEATGDYSGAARKFIFQPAVDTYITQFGIKLRGTGSIDFDDYGTISALTNGIAVDVVQGAQTRKGAVISPIKTNWDLIVINNAQSGASVGQGGGAQSAFVSLLDFTEMANGGFFLAGGGTDRIEVTVNDNFTGLLNHNFIVYGSVD